MQQSAKTEDLSCTAKKFMPIINQEISSLMPVLSNMSTRGNIFSAIFMPLEAWKLFPFAWINFTLPIFLPFYFHKSDNITDVIFKVL